MLTSYVRPSRHTFIPSLSLSLSLSLSVCVCICVSSFQVVLVLTFSYAVIVAAALAHPPTQRKKMQNKTFFIFLPLGML